MRHALLYLKGIVAAVLGTLAAGWRLYLATRPPQELDDFSHLPAVSLDHTASSTPPEAPKQPPTAPLPHKPVPMNPDALLPWTSIANNRHNVRALCDLEGLSFKNKNDLCATVAEESGFILTARRDNYANGKVWSTDWGICQWNDYFHKDEITPDQAVHNPEKAVRLMCRYWKKGEAFKRQWVAYKTGAYKKHLPLGI